MSETVERYIGFRFDALDLLATAGTDNDVQVFARNQVRKIEAFLADHIDDVRDTRDRLMTRDDAMGRAMVRYANRLLQSYEESGQAAREAIERARHGG